MNKKKKERERKENAITLCYRIPEIGNNNITDDYLPPRIFVNSRRGTEKGRK